MHFCGGELEDISYITKEVTCCGEIVEDDMDDDCCKNENLVVKFVADGLLSEFNYVSSHDQSVNLEFLLNEDLNIISESNNCFVKYVEPPEKKYLEKIIATSVLRI